MQNAELRIKKSEARPAGAEAIGGNIRHALFGAFRSSFCLRHSAFCLSSGGQAMIEFTIALVAIMAVIIGTIMLNRMEWAQTHTMTTARATAGALALDLIYQSELDAKFIADWEPGPDNIRYTQDDEPVPDGTAMALAGDIVANAGLGEVASLPTNAITRLQSSPTPINEFYLVKGSESMAVDLSVIPAVRQLLSGEPTISVKSEAWLAWTGGIY